MRWKNDIAHRMSRISYRSWLKIKIIVLHQKNNQTFFPVEWPLQKKKGKKEGKERKRKKRRKRIEKKRKRKEKEKKKKRKKEKKKKKKKTTKNELRSVIGPLVWRRSRTSNISMTSSVVCYPFVSSEEWGHDVTNVARSKTGSSDCIFIFHHRKLVFITIVIRFWIHHGFFESLRYGAWGWRDVAWKRTRRSAKQPLLCFSDH